MPIFWDVRGCTLQDLAYQDQLALKQQWVHRALQALDPALRVDEDGHGAQLAPQPTRALSDNDVDRGVGQRARRGVSHGTPVQV